MSKKAERCYKILFNNAPGRELSSTNCHHYRKRFMDFMKDKVFNYDYNHTMEERLSLNVRSVNSAAQSISLPETVVMSHNTSIARSEDSSNILRPKNPNRYSLNNNNN